MLFQALNSPAGQFNQKQDCSDGVVDDNNQTGATNVSVLCAQKCKSSILFIILSKFKFEKFKVRELELLPAKRVGIGNIYLT